MTAQPSDPTRIAAKRTADRMKAIEATILKEGKEFTKDGTKPDKYHETDIPNLARPFDIDQIITFNQQCIDFERIKDWDAGKKGALLSANYPTGLPPQEVKYDSSSTPIRNAERLWKQFGDAVSMRNGELAKGYKMLAEEWNNNESEATLWGLFTNLCNDTRRIVRTLFAYSSDWSNYSDQALLQSAKVIWTSREKLRELASIDTKIAQAQIELDQLSIQHADEIDSLVVIEGIKSQLPADKLKLAEDLLDSATRKAKEALKPARTKNSAVLEKLVAQRTAASARAPSVTANSEPIQPSILNPASFNANGSARHTKGKSRGVENKENARPTASS